MLDTFWCGRGFPVDPAKIAHDMGLDVFITDLPGKVSGALIKQKDQDPAIFLNSDDNKVRQRFHVGMSWGITSPGKHRIAMNMSTLIYVAKPQAPERILMKFLQTSSQQNF